MSSEEIWNKFSEKIKYFLYKRVTDKTVADDLLQEVFIKIHTRLPLLKEEEKVGKWVFQIAYNQLKDYFRLVNKTLFYSLSTNKTTELFLTETDDSHELQDCLTPFIQSLPTIYKDAVVLSEVEGLKQKEVAKRLGLSESGAKSRIQRGRELIKQHFIDCCHFHLGNDGKLKGEHYHDHESWNCNDADCLIHPEKK